MASQNPQFTSAAKTPVTQMVTPMHQNQIVQSSQFQGNTLSVSQVKWGDSSESATYFPECNPLFTYLAAPQVTQIGGPSGQSNAVPFDEFQYNMSSVSQVPWRETSQPATYFSGNNTQFTSLAAPQVTQIGGPSGQSNAVPLDEFQYNVSSVSQVPWRETSQPVTYFSGSNPQFPSFAAPQADLTVAPPEQIQTTQSIQHSAISVDQFLWEPYLQPETYFSGSTPPLSCPSASRVTQIGSPLDQLQTKSSVQFQHDVYPVSQPVHISQPGTYPFESNPPFPPIGAAQTNQGPMQSAHSQHSGYSVNPFRWKPTLQSDAYLSESSPQSTSSAAPRVDRIDGHSDQFQSVPVEQFQHNVSSLRQVPWKQNSLPEMYISGSDPKFLSFTAPEVNQKVNQPGQTQTAQSVRFQDNALSVSQVQCIKAMSQKTRFSGSRLAGDENSNATERECTECTCPNCLKGGEYDETGVKMHACHVPGCEKVFKGSNGSYNLRIHNRSHTGERPFKCDQPSCSIAYRTVDALNRHLELHTGRFRCHECSINFHTDYSLMKHRQSQWHGICLTNEMPISRVESDWYETKV